MQFTTRSPVVLIIYKRPQYTKSVFDVIRIVKPSKLYLIADGPKNESEQELCAKTRLNIEKRIDWDCELKKIYSTDNLGCARRVQTGLDEVFRNEEQAIILEDDTLPDPSFFKFCDDLLELYKNNEKVGHISGCNLHPEAFHTNYSYCFSSIINIWGWATWKRSWINYDLKMGSWLDQNKDCLLNTWCVTKKHKKSTRKMFDLHCNNENPWSWDFQWNFSCWSNNRLSIIPSVNLVSNLGIGPDASNTKALIQIPLFPDKISSIKKITHPEKVSKDTEFDSEYFKHLNPGLFQNIRNLIRVFINKVRCL